MSTGMNIVVAYDGSDCADRALEDLKVAGIPDGSTVTVVSVAEWFPLPTATGVGGIAPIPPVNTLQDAEQLAEMGRERVAKDHPTWTVAAEGYVGSPAHQIIRCAQDHNAELIVTGSHGRSMLGRAILGSVSNQVLAGAPCSVRVSRGVGDPDGGPRPILIALDGSTYTDKVVDTVLRRSWPPEIECIVLTSSEYSYDPAEEAELLKGAQEMHKRVMERLNEHGFRTRSVIDTEETHPRRAILSEAESAGVSAIFLGARGLTGFQRFVLGSVSGSVAIGAKCSVEVVHA